MDPKVGQWVWAPTDALETTRTNEPCVVTSTSPLRVAPAARPKTSRAADPTALRPFALVLGSGAAVADPNARALASVDALAEVSDLSCLVDESKAAVAETLRVRYGGDAIYTLAGSVLVAVNPYKRIARPETTGYVDPAAPESPDIASVAGRAVLGLKTTGHTQSVIVSGESGAGKTESTKLVIEHIIDICGGGPNSATGRSSSSAAAAETAASLLASAPIMEAFGNATTRRNDNSSRFGTWFSLFMQRDCAGLGAASKTTYLLEKSRVVRHPPGERNFHVFYQLFAGLADGGVGAAATGAATRLAGRRAAEFRALVATSSGGAAEGGAKVRPSDGKDFREVLEAMRTLKFTDAQVTAVMKSVAAVLHLANVEFDEAVGATGNSAAHVASGGASRRAFEDAAAVLSVEPAALERVLTLKAMRSGHRASVVFIELDAAGAANARDALAKALFSALFDWTVGRINAAMAGPEGDAGGEASAGGSIGMLDIFGFEIMATNSFEQLCINWANEQLQRHFNTNTFTKELELYAEQGITCEAVAFEDNADVIQCVDGLFKTLDDVAAAPRPSSASFFAQAKKQHAAHPRLAFDRIKPNFVLTHYAGPVEYESLEFHEKNADKVNPDLIEAIAASSDPAVAALAAPLVGDAGADGGGGRRKKQLKTVSAKFRHGLGDLVDALNHTHPHFVKCIKPNTLKKPGVFDGALVAFQLTVLGIFEAVKIMRSGFPVKMPLNRFCDRYRLLVDKAHRDGDDAALYARVDAQYIGPRAGPNPRRAPAACGRSIVFMTPDACAGLESARRVVLARAVVRVQTARRTRNAMASVVALCRAAEDLIEAAASLDPALMRAAAAALAEAELKLTGKRDGTGTGTEKMGGVVAEARVAMAEALAVYELQRALEEHLVGVLARASTPRGCVDAFGAMSEALKRAKAVGHASPNVKRVQAAHASVKRVAALEQSLAEATAAYDRKAMADIIETLHAARGDKRGEAAGLYGVLDEGCAAAEKLVAEATELVGTKLPLLLADMADGTLRLAQGAGLPPGALEPGIGSARISEALEARGMAETAKAAPLEIKAAAALAAKLRTARGCAQEGRWADAGAALEGAEADAAVCGALPETDAELALFRRFATEQRLVTESQASTATGGIPAGPLGAAADAVVMDTAALRACVKLASGLGDPWVPLLGAATAAVAVAAHTLELRGAAADIIAAEAALTAARPAAGVVAVDAGDDEPSLLRQRHLALDGAWARLEGAHAAAAKLANGGSVGDDEAAGSTSGGGGGGGDRAAVAAAEHAMHADAERAAAHLAYRRQYCALADAVSGASDGEWRPLAAAVVAATARGAYRTPQLDALVEAAATLLELLAARAADGGRRGVGTNGVLRRRDAAKAHRDLAWAGVGGGGPDALPGAWDQAGVPELPQ